MGRKGQSLPEIFSHPLPSAVDAHNRCRQVESRIFEALESNLNLLGSTKSVLESQLMYLRIVGYLLFHVPLDTGKEHVAQSVLSCKTDEDIFDLGKIYQQHFICVCKF